MILDAAGKPFTHSPTIPAHRFEGTIRAPGRTYSPPPQYDHPINIARAALLSPMQPFTPLLMMNLDCVTDVATRMQKNMPRVNAFHYAIKCNSDARLVKHIHGLGLRVEVANAWELHKAISVGFKPEQIAFTHPTKSEDAIYAIKKYKPGMIIVDSIDGLLQLNREGIPSADYKPNLGFRVQALGSGLNKFGQPPYLYPDGYKEGEKQSAPEFEAQVDMGQIVDFFRTAHKSGGFSGLTLCFHAGTNQTDLNAFKNMIGFAGMGTNNNGLMARLLEYGIKIDLDIGGGFPSRMQAESKHPTADGTAQDRIFRKVNEYLEKYLPPWVNVMCEPGRSLVADAGTIVTQLLARKICLGERLLPSLRNGLGINKNDHFMLCEFDDSLYLHLMGEKHDDRHFVPIPFLLDPRQDGFSNILMPCFYWGHSCDGFDKLSDQVEVFTDEQMKKMVRRGGHYLPINAPANSQLGLGTLFIFVCSGAYTVETSTAKQNEPGFNGLTADLMYYQALEDGLFDCELYRGPWVQYLDKAPPPSRCIINFDQTAQNMRAMPFPSGYKSVNR